MPTNLTDDQLLALARHGAEARLNELRAEIEAIEQTFASPSKRGRKSRPRAARTTNGFAEGESRPNRPSWPPAARKAAAARMKAWWAKRNAERK